jgi:Family of unknown function (DUF5947)
MPAANGGLRRLAQRSTLEREAAAEHCELCGTVIPSAHSHVLALATRDVKCACRPCGILFDRRAAAEGRYRLIPDRRLAVSDLALDDTLWEELRLPVDVAFFFHVSAAGRVVAYYPSPMGPTESQLELSAWAALEAANPLLRTLEPDVEALLVNRVRGARHHLVVPIDECYALVGLIRTRWRGLTGGKEVWEELARFFADLERRSRVASRNDIKELTWAR